MGLCRVGPCFIIMALYATITCFIIGVNNNSCLLFVVTKISLPLFSLFLCHGLLGAWPGGVTQSG